VYVVNSGGNTISVIATASNTVVDTIPVGSEPTGIAITPDGTRAYFANASDGIDVVEIATNTVVDTIFVNVPAAVAITPDGTHAYTLSNNPPIDNHVDETVTVIDTATNTVVGSPITIGLAVPIVVFTIAVTPDGTGVYVPNASAQSVSVICTTSNTVTGSVGVGDFPVAVAFSPAVLFSAFSARLDISPNGFDLKGSFALGAGGTVNPPTQALTLRAGTYTVTVPAGSFKAPDSIRILRSETDYSRKTIAFYRKCETEDTGRHRDGWSTFDRTV
jgi:YVTN family beta-propeller protein